MASRNAAGWRLAGWLRDREVRGIDPALPAESRPMEHTLRAHQLFAAMSDAQAETILGWLRTEEKQVWRNSVTMLAGQRKVRPVFIQQKPGREQIAWVKQSLGRLPGDDAATHLLQVWLLRERSAMLVTFLDALGIEHDGKGGVEDLPRELDSAKLREAVAKLEVEYPIEEVRLYLHLFQRQQQGGWPELDALIGEAGNLRW